MFTFKKPKRNIRGQQRRRINDEEDNSDNEENGGGGEHVAPKVICNVRNVTDHDIELEIMKIVGG